MVYANIEYRWYVIEWRQYFKTYTKQATDFFCLFSASIFAKTYSRSGDKTHWTVCNLCTRACTMSGSSILDSTMCTLCTWFLDTGSMQKIPYKCIEYLTITGCLAKFYCACICLLVTWSMANLMANHFLPVNIYFSWWHLAYNTIWIIFRFTLRAKGNSSVLLVW